MTRCIVQVTSPRLPYTHVFLYSVQRNQVQVARAYVYYKALEDLGRLALS